MVDITGGVFGLFFHWGMLHCMWVQHECQQNCVNSDGRILLIHALVGEEGSDVSSLITSRVDLWADLGHDARTWALILGMSGLVVLFWFAGGGVALRYFVSPPVPFPSSLDCNLHEGTLHRSDVMHVCAMGCHR